MKSPKPNRFIRADKPGEETPRAPAGGPAIFLDVEGQVTFDGEAPREVEVFGQKHAFDAHGRVCIQSREYRLVRVEGRWCLEEAWATRPPPDR